MTAAGHRSIWQNAAVSTLVGLCFSLVLSAVIVVGLALRATPVVAVERAGIDLGMRLQAFFWPGSTVDAAAAPPLALFDVTLEACKKFDPRGELSCRTSNPVPPCLILDFVRAASAGGARAIVVDIDLSGQIDQPLGAPCRDGDRTLGQALGALDPNGPPVIVPLDVRPDNEAPDHFWTDPARKIIPGLAAGPVRLAVFVASPDAAASDGVLRRAALLTHVSTDLKGGEAVLPSAAYLAALLAQPRTAGAADCVFYGQRCAGADTTEVARMRRIRRLEPDATSIAIPFTLQSLALDTAQSGCEDAGLFQRRSLDCRYADVYQRFRVDDVAPAGRFQTSQLYFMPHDRAAIAVLGTSLASAFDLRRTPIGMMSGSEVMINAIRSFSSHDPLAVTEPTAGGLAAFLRKAAGALLATPILYLGWLAIHRVSRSVEQAGWRRRIVLRVSVAGIFLLTMLGVALFEYSNLLVELHRTSAGGERVDFLIPLLSMGLEGYTEASLFLVHSIEPLAVALVAAAVARAMAARSWARSLIAKIANQGKEEEDVDANVP